MRLVVEEEKRGKSKKIRRKRMIEKEKGDMRLGMEKE